MKNIRAGLIVAMGFFALVAQTLLFRVHLAAFEGNELAVGAFFGSWLLWVALGALLGRGNTRFHQRALTCFPALPLVYLPAFLLQSVATANIRALASVAPYELFPFLPMLGLALLTNIPVSACTGFLFTMACRWAPREHGLPVARVYALEAFGACLGGIYVTALLAWGAHGQTLALGAATAFALAVALQDTAIPAWWWRTLRTVPCAILAILLVTGTGGLWARWDRQRVWERLLPIESYRGSFTTAQAEYRYGEREGQFIVMTSGGVCEALPDEAHASEVVAVNLAQTPEAHSVLLIGPGSLAVGLRLLELPQIDTVVWLHPDPEYPARLIPLLPDEFADAARAITMPGADVRTYLAQAEETFDLAILNLPDATTLVLNRYSTAEFFRLLKPRLKAEAVVSLRTTGAANYMGSELACLGASALTTLDDAFAHRALKPGDETWISVSGASVLAQPGDALAARYREVPGAATVYPPEAIPALYPEDRIAFQLEAYRRAEERLGRALLLNTDAHPKALLYVLLITLRMGGAGFLSHSVPLALAIGLPLLAAIALLYAFLRSLYVVRGTSTAEASTSPSPAVFDGLALVFAMGLAGMGLSIVLMFLYQARFGALFLHVGLVSALFMLGSYAGARILERVLADRAHEDKVLLPACIVAHLGLILITANLSPDAPRILFAALFLLGGVFTGAYFPIAAFRLKAAGRSVAEAGARLELLDHLGGALGGVVTGLLLLPLFGAPGALVLLALLIGANALPAVAVCVPFGARPSLAQGDPFRRAARAVGYVLFGVGAWAVVTSHSAGRYELGQETQRLLTTARRMADDTGLHEEQARLPGGEDVIYYRTDDEHLVFSTEHFAPSASGYAGPVTLAVCVDGQGLLQGVRILASNETPSYLDLVRPWCESLAGACIFDPKALDSVDGVSGATLTSDAVLAALRQAGPAFAAHVLGRNAAARPSAATRSMAPDRGFLCLLALTAAAVAIRYRPGLWRRRILLVLSLTAGGVWLNTQYSSQQVIALLHLQWPALRPTGALFLLAGVPLVGLLFGNVYCGYVCPFGAAQELLGELRPRRFDAEPRKRVWRYGRFAKYILLVFLLVLYALRRDYTVLAAEPLVTFFGAARTQIAMALGAAALVLSIPFRRFWCRNLCPAGAFLAFLNGPRLLRRVLPPTRPARCDLGVETVHDLDCIHCDRCRHETR